MPRSTKHTTQQHFDTSSLEEGVKVPLPIAVALIEGQTSLQIRQIELAQAAISENSQYWRSVLENTQDYSGMFERWSTLCQVQAKQYGEFREACIEIMVQSSAEVNHLISGSLSEIAASNLENLRDEAAPAIDRRVSARVISFPERRVESLISHAVAQKSGRQHAA